MAAAALIYQQRIQPLGRVERSEYPPIQGAIREGRWVALCLPTLQIGSASTDRRLADGYRPAPQPCRALCPRRGENDRFLYLGARLCRQRRGRGRAYHLPVA